MATIASLDIALGANSAKLKTDLAKAEKNVKGFASNAKKHAAGMSNAFKGVAASLAAIGAVAVIGNLMKTADALEESATAANITFDAYQRLVFGMKILGFSGESVNKSLTKLNKVIFDAKDGSKGAADTLGDIGLSFEDLIKLSPDQRFLRVVDALDKVGDSGKRAVLTQELLGKEFINFKGNSAGITEASKNLLVLSDAAAQASASFIDAFDLFATNAGNTLLNALAPVIQVLADVMNHLSQFSAENPVMAQVLAGITILGTTIAGALIAIQIVGAAPIAILAALSLAVMGIVYAVTNWTSIVQWFTEVLASTFNVSVAEAAGWIDALGNAFAAAWDWAVGFAGFLGETFVGVLGFVWETVQTVAEVFLNLVQAVYDLFTLDFAGFGQNMIEAFTAAKDWFFESFVSAVSGIATFVGSALTSAVVTVADAFGSAMADAVTWLAERLTGMLEGVRSFFAGISFTVGGDGVARGPGSGGPNRGDIAKNGGTVAPTVPTVDLGPATSYPGSGGVSPLGMTTGVPLTSVVLPPNETDVRTAEATESIAEALTEDGSGGSGGGSGGAGKKPATKEKAEEVSDTFLDQMKNAFTKALVSGDWKGFLTDMLDNFTMRIIESFSNGLMDALFGGIDFDGMFENFGKQINDGLSGALSGAGAGGGGGIFGFLGGLFGFADGGLVPSDTPYSRIGRDSVPAMLTPGELVVPVGEVGNFVNQNGGSPININITGDISRQTKKEIYAMLPEISKGVNNYNHEIGSRT